MYEESYSKGDYPFVKNINLFNLIQEYLDYIEKSLSDLENNVELTPNLKLCNSLLLLIKTTAKVSHNLGVKVIDQNDSLEVILTMVREISGICMSIYDNENNDTNVERSKRIIRSIQNMHNATSIPNMDSVTTHYLENNEKISQYSTK